MWAKDCTQSAQPGRAEGPGPLNTKDAPVATISSLAIAKESFEVAHRIALF